MADIELVIKIPEELYEANNKGLEAEAIWDLRMAIKNGCRFQKDTEDDLYPCNKCNHSADKRKDYWQYAEEVEDGNKD